MSDADDPRTVRVSIVDLGPDGPAPLEVRPPERPGGRHEATAATSVDGHTRPDNTPTLRWLGGGRAELRAPSDGGRHDVLLPDRTARTQRNGAVRSEVVVDGWRFEVEVESATRANLRDVARRGRSEIAHSGPTDVRAIIPGVVVGVAVASGDVVTAGQQLLVVEAMKMQNELRAPRAGTIDRVVVATGSRIDVGDLLVVLA